MTWKRKVASSQPSFLLASINLMISLAKTNNKVCIQPFIIFSFEWSFRITLRSRLLLHPFYTRRSQGSNVRWFDSKLQQNQDLNSVFLQILCHLPTSYGMHSNILLHEDLKAILEYSSGNQLTPFCSFFPSLSLLPSQVIDANIFIPLAKQTVEWGHQEHYLGSQMRGSKLWPGILQLCEVG